METLWDTIHRDLTDNGSLSTYKVDVKELTNHLDQLYSKIEELESEIRQLKGE
jgi:prefoldin subunit 5